jgi:hypothetical protein
VDRHHGAELSQGERVWRQEKLRELIVLHALSHQELGDDQPDIIGLEEHADVLMRGVEGAN